MVRTVTHYGTQKFITVPLGVTLSPCYSFHSVVVCVPVIAWCTCKQCVEALKPSFSDTVARYYEMKLLCVDKEV
jgi:hypothetical protein